MGKRETERQIWIETKIWRYIQAEFVLYDFGLLLAKTKQKIAHIIKHKLKDSNGKWLVFIFFFFSSETDSSILQEKQSSSSHFPLYISVLVPHKIAVHFWKSYYCPHSSSNFNTYICYLAASSYTTPTSES